VGGATALIAPPLSYQSSSSFQVPIIGIGFLSIKEVLRKAGAPCADFIASRRISQLSF